MKFTQFKIGFLSIALLLSAGSSIEAMQADRSAQDSFDFESDQDFDVKGFQNHDDRDDHCSPLKITNLCSHRIKAKSIAAKRLCAQKIQADHLHAEHATVTRKLCAHDVHAPKACLGDLTVENICSNGLTKVNTFQQCGKYRATAVFSTVTTYTLGTPVNFDVELDDPNNNQTVAPFSYTAPLSGYYIVTLQIDQRNLQTFGGDPILGTPVANIDIQVNGVTRRQAFFPYLTFHNEQFANISALVSLRAGDVVTARYTVFALNDGGFGSVAGTVDILGNGSTDNQSIFKIHYLSSDCVDLPCGGCNFNCETKQDQCCPKLDCNPCHRD